MKTYTGKLKNYSLCISDSSTSTQSNTEVTRLTKLSTRYTTTELEVRQGTTLPNTANTQPTGVSPRYTTTELEVGQETTLPSIHTSRSVSTSNPALNRSTSEARISRVTSLTTAEEEEMTTTAQNKVTASTYTLTPLALTAMRLEELLPTVIMGSLLLVILMAIAVVVLVRWMRRRVTPFPSMELPLSRSRTITTYHHFVCTIMTNDDVVHNLQRSRPWLTVSPPKHPWRPSGG